VTHNDCHRQPLVFEQVKTFLSPPNLTAPPKRLVWIRHWLEVSLSLKLLVYWREFLLKICLKMFENERRKENSVQWTDWDSYRECLIFDKVGKYSSSTKIISLLLIIINASYCIRKTYCRQFTLKPSSGILILPYASVKLGYNATHNLHTSSWDTWQPLFPYQTIFYFHIVNHFRNKIISAQRNVHIQILCMVPPKKDFLESFFLFVRRKCQHVLDPFIFRSSHGVGKLITYKVLVVISGQTDFALKIVMKC